jgi:flagellar M-ring protein FliF
MEDIEIESKSEARKLIDKFVDENPEAAANLLRNWLSEEWG